MKVPQIILPANQQKVMCVELLKLIQPLLRHEGHRKLHDCKLHVHNGCW
jgi:hypothetical protein